MEKRAFIKSYGCQMNVYDSARMADVLTACGYGKAADAEDADLVILNTCHIREKAAEKVYSELGRLRVLQETRRRGGRPLRLGVAGCVAQAEGEEMLRRAPFVDLVVGPQAYHRLPDLLARTEAAIDIEFPVEPKFDHLPAPVADGTVSAFLTVQEGCDRFCSFCVVPYTRGAEYSRPAAEVIAEARLLAAGGAREIVLLGQNVNAYHGRSPDGAGEWGLGRLARALAEIEDVMRIRYTTSHPRDMDDELIEAHRSVPQLMPFLHLPVQSGSDGVLAAMNRRHRADDYVAIIERLRAARPDIALSSDFIVGFPGESDADFEATLELVRRVRFAQSYSFKYSPRPGTPAAAEDDQVPEAVKDARLAALQGLLAAQQREFNRAAVGRTVPVLFEREGRRPGQATGRSPWMQPVYVAAEEPDALAGRIADVEIVEAKASSLAGRLAA